MGRIIKFAAYFVGAVIALLVVAIIVVSLLFDPNDYRDQIEAVVETNTGRELEIEGDLGLSLFPWLAVEVGATRLGNAAGFGPEPMLSFASARLSVRLLPALLRRDIQVATAELDGLQLNLAVDANGLSNWQDLLEASNTETAAAEADSGASGSASLDIAGVEISDATIRYQDEQAGTDVTLNELNISLGAISSLDAALQIDGFSLEAMLEGLSATPTVFGLRTDTVAIDTAAQVLTMAAIELELLGLEIAANPEPLSFAGDITPVAAIEIAPFSLRNLMERMDIEPPVTADPAALGRVSISATARVGNTAIALDDLELQLDDTRFTGRLAIPQGDNDVFEMQLVGDAIDLDRYMAPVTDAAASGSETNDAPVEIPVELIRLLNARGDFRLASATFSGMQFEAIEVGLLLDDDTLRMHPFTATLFEGRYNGDIRIDARSDTPELAVNERIEAVQLGALAAALFEQDNITGTINGQFQLRGRGADLAAIQRDLNGSISMALADGAFEGTDIWYELRQARALIKQETPPEPVLPARTEFGRVELSGPVANGVFDNDRLEAVLPFMQLTGRGTVNLVEATVDYSVNARVFEKPELMGDGVTEDELKDLAKVRIPIRISGPLVAPSVKPDTKKLVEEAAKKEVENVLKDKLKDLLN